MSITNLPVSEILENVLSMEQNFALTLIDPLFKGTQKLLLKKFIMGEVSHDDVVTQWNQLSYSGSLKDDVRLDTLKVLDRLKLLSLVLKKLEISSKDIDLMFDFKEYSKEELVSAFSILINDLSFKNNLKIKKKEGQNMLLKALESVSDNEISECNLLLPHAPAIKEIEDNSPQIEEINSVEAVVL